MLNKRWSIAPPFEPLFARWLKFAWRSHFFIPLGFLAIVAILIDAVFFTCWLLEGICWEGYNA